MLELAGRLAPLILGSILFGQAPGGVDELRVGHWVRVKGTTRGEGVLVADEVELRQPNKENEIIGTVTEIRAEAKVYAVLVIEGQPVFIGPKCRLRGVDLSSLNKLVGARVEVEGYWRSPLKFSARELEVRRKGRDRLEGRIDTLEGGVAGWQLTIMGRRVLVPHTTQLEADAPIRSFAMADKVLYVDLTRRPRRVDDDDEIRGHKIAPGLWAGARLEWRRFDERNFNLDKEDREDRVDNDFAIRGQLFWVPSDRVFGLFDFRHAWRRRVDEDDGRFSQNAGRIAEAYIYLRDVLVRGFDLQIGRQDFDETREWIYDENLDAVRAILRRYSLRFELFAATILHGGRPLDENTKTFGATVTTSMSSDWMLSSYVIRRDSDLIVSREALHFGVRAFGEFIDRNESWVEIAGLAGQGGDLGLGGWGFDVGTTWYPRALDPWYFTVGLAFGSGDGDFTDGTDGTFRQTGLQDNNRKLGGVTSFRYYGELMDPELANLRIGTIGIGRRLGRRNSVDLVYHKYDQDIALTTIIDSDLDRDPSGLSRDLGWELDLILGSRALERVNLEVVVGRFDPGDAFPGADAAWIGKLQVRIQL